jgi:hypothetical protein
VSSWNLTIGYYAGRFRYRNTGKNPDYPNVTTTTIRTWILGRPEPPREQEWPRETPLEEVFSSSLPVNVS